jgi:hypothetical protein
LVLALLWQRCDGFDGRPSWQLEVVAVMDGTPGWIQANTDTRNNPELEEPGGAYRQLKHRVFGTLTALAVLALVLVALGLGVFAE